MRTTTSIGCILIITLAFSCQDTTSLKHHLVLKNDHRVYFSVSSFGYLLGGRLDVIVQNLTIWPDPSEDSPTTPQFGFMLIKLDAMRNPLMINLGGDRERSCMLHVPGTYFNYDLITMSLEPSEKKVLVKCTSDNELPPIRSLTHDSRKDAESPHSSYIHKHNKRAVVQPNNSMGQESATTSPQNSVELGLASNKMRRNMNSCSKSEPHLPLIVTQNAEGRNSYSFNFTMFVRDEKEEGFYYLTFHNCRGHKGASYTENSPFTVTRFHLDMLLYETNWPQNYLSAGSMPLPQMYFMLSVMFFLIGCIWLNFIKQQRENTLKIHTLMSVLVFAKASSLLFHGINYHYIAIDGQPVVTWAYIYYATRSVKGALFFITLALIGSGWSFIKHILSDKDKKIIMIVVALQVIAHIAEIVLDESTEGENSNEFWAELCSMVDLFSCVAILVPISWSVKHLEEASRTDGKAAINLKKLELFKRFYIISTIYIYITRIITFLFLSMLSYKYSWLAELVSELVTLIYFIITGYYFQPMPTNPYLLLSSENDSEEDILFSVDTKDMNSTRFEEMRDQGNQQEQDTNTLLKEGKQKMTRRIVEDIV